jgi:CheY-like chemotaxis protein
MPKINCILLVDDDNVINYLHKIVIKDLGIAREIEIKNNGKEGINFIRERCQNGNCPELILVDLKMPVMDGFEFIDAYQQLPIDREQIKVAMLTTSSNPKDVQKIKEKGIEDYLNKPLNEESLLNLINKYFKNSH